MAEAVDHPPHYNAHPSGVEAVDVCEHLSFNLGNALKYVWRAGLKGDRQEDLEKAKWYVRREVERFTAYDSEGVSVWDGEGWKPFARKVQSQDKGLLGIFLWRLLRMRVPDSLVDLKELLAMLESA